MNYSHKKNILTASCLLIIIIMILSTVIVNADYYELKLPISVSNNNISNPNNPDQQSLSKTEITIKFYDQVGINAIGISPAGTFEGAIRITPDELSPYEGWILTAARFYHYVEDGTNETHSGKIKIYDGGTSSNPGSLNVSELYNATGQGWKRINLSNPIVLNITKDIWVSVEITHNEGEYPISTDDGPAVDGKGDWISVDGGATWSELQDHGTPPLDYNWNIEAIISDIGGDLIADAGGPYKEHVNETVYFQGSAIGGFPPYMYYWDFGDGNISSEQNPTHIYTEIGNYTVSFNVTDSFGNFDIDNTTATIVEEGEDITPPVTYCNLTGEMYGDIYIGDVTVTLTAFDNESGVNRTMFKLNDNNYSSYTVPFNVSEEGNYTVYFYSVDNKSNVEEEKSCSFKIEHRAELEIDITRNEINIRNIGKYNATNVVWSLDIKGGVFGLTDIHDEERVDILAVNQLISRDIPFLLGFGRIEIVVIADATNAKEEVVEVARGLLILFILLGI